MKRHRPERKVSCKFIYKGSKEVLADRLAAVATRRRQLATELDRLHRFLDKHPEFRERIAAMDSGPRLRVVADNTRRQIKRRPHPAPDPSSAA